MHLFRSETSTLRTVNGWETVNEWEGGGIKRSSGAYKHSPPLKRKEKRKGHRSITIGGQTRKKSEK